MSKNVTRLYEQFAPENYKISLTISEDKKNFQGSVIITGKKQGRPSNRITLHQKALKITDAKLTKVDKKSDKQNVEIKRCVAQNKFDEYRLHTNEVLYPGNYEIELKFNGNITKNMDGVYPCFFEDNGVKKELIATQFESHHAREAFPCIDEPEAKATFDLALTHAKDEIALGNTPAEKSHEENKTITTTFEQTPVMSTYLLAFVIGELDYREAKSKSGILLRTYATKNQIEHTEFALSIAVKSMDFYEEYFDVPFPLPKCDFVALPDFASGAMENWGLITFREQALLCDDKNTSLSTKQWVAMVVAHELTHQWFGNLVTMRWWTDLWLNEGFASWMEYLALDELYPEWNIWTQFAIDEQQVALKADALEHTHAIEVPVRHPDEIRSIFDVISYQKGSSAIHMLYNYLGSDGFRDGLRHYLKEHAYKNTDTVDLWQALENATKKPVKEFMNAWTSQPGYPLLNVERKNDHLKITQTRFVTNPESKARNDNSLWPVPLLTSGIQLPITDKKVTNIPIGKDIPPKINIGQTGFYRVDYSNEIQELQIKALESGALDPVDRMGLLSDGFEATKAGYQPVSDYLDLLAHYKNEDSLPVWEIMVGSIGAIRANLSSSDTDNELRDKMKPFMLELIKPQLDRLGWDENKNETHLDTLLRPIIIGMAAGVDNKAILKKVQNAYRDKIDSKKHVNPDLRGTIYGTIARLGNNKEFDELLSLYKDSDSSDEKLSLTAGMTSFEQPEIHKKVLSLIESDTIRTQDKTYWIAYSLMNRHSKQVTWKWYRDNWDWIKDEMGTDLSFSRMPIYAARCFNTAEQITQYIDFFDTRLTPGLERSYNQGLEIAQTSSAWHVRDQKIAKEWFTD